MYVDFKEVSARANIADVAALLGLKLKKSGDQLRGPCPVHPNGDRSLVITPSKGLWFCFEPSCRKGGDVIELVAKVKGVSQKEAAQFLASHYEIAKAAKTIDLVALVDGDLQAPKLKGPLDYLQHDHDAVVALGLEPETCRRFAAGYAPKGIMRGRLAIPIHDLDGKLVAYCGRAVGGQEPRLIFPKEFEPEQWIWNAQALQPSAASIARDPLHALLAHQNGLDNVASLLSPITQLTLATLTLVLSKKGVPEIEIF